MSGLVVPLVLALVLALPAFRWFRPFFRTAVCDAFAAAVADFWAVGNEHHMRHARLTAPARRVRFAAFPRFRPAISHRHSPIHGITSWWIWGRDGPAVLEQGRAGTRGSPNTRPPRA